MKSIIVAGYWSLIFVIMGVLTWLEIPRSVPQPLGWLLLFIPAMALVPLFFIERAIGCAPRNLSSAIIRGILATPFLVLGYGWLCTFALTNYRSGHRPVGLLAAALFLAVGFCVVHLGVADESRSSE